jgi:hypothetical protein
LAFGQLYRVICTLLRKALYTDQWFLLFDLHGEALGSVAEFRTLIPPKDRSWADPHIMCRDGTYYVFLEELLHARGKGHISVLEVSSRGEWKGPELVLEKQHHLSYPFVFEWDGHVYMIPETAGGRSIELYECVEFPYRWQHRMNLMKDIDAVDTTVLHYRDRWWLFTNIAENRGSSYDDELFLFYSEDLLGGNWKSHPKNPIVSDVKRARPAGRILEKNGQLYRLSQDCSRIYGYGFNLSRIVVLTESEYEEILIDKVRPDWDKRVEATHSYAEEGALTVIDAFVRRRRLF